MEKVASHIFHTTPTARRTRAHPKTIVQELQKLVPGKQLMLDGKVQGAHWKAFKDKYKFTSASMAALIRVADEKYLSLKFVKGGKNLELHEHSARFFSNFIKEKKIVTFEDDAHFNRVTLDPLKIQGIEARNAIRIKARDGFPFSMIDFENIPGGSIEGAMSCPFYKPFITKFVDYGCPWFREVDIWFWIVEDRKSEQVYEIVCKLQPEYAVLKSPYVAALADGAYNATKNKKTKMVKVICLYFVYKVELLNVQNHPITWMQTLFKVPDGTDDSKALYDEAKYAKYPQRSYVWSFTYE